jgi:hypothetical protein
LLIENPTISNETLALCLQLQHQPRSLLSKVAFGARSGVAILAAVASSHLCSPCTPRLGEIPNTSLRRECRSPPPAPTPFGLGQPPPSKPPQRAWTVASRCQPLCADAPNTGQVTAGTRQGSRYHGDAPSTVSSPPRTFPPSPLAGRDLRRAHSLGCRVRRSSCCDLSPAGPPRGGHPSSQEVLFLLLILPHLLLPPLPSLCVCIHSFG